MSTPASDEIQLTQIFEILTNKKFFIIGVTLISFLTGLFYSLSIENEYTSISILQAQDGDQRGLNLIDQYSGVAALAAAKTFDDATEKITSDENIFDSVTGK
jgi:LPS O-antigen subunit length determinant protein (WzzB/FepE family)